MKLRYLPRADRDLRDIFDWLAADDLDTAEKIVDRLRVAINKLRNLPGKGPPQSDKGSGVRKLSAWPYVVYYRVSRTEITVGRVVHGRRDLSRIAFRG